MVFVPKRYLEPLKKRDFFLLILITFIGQLASAFLMLSLIVSVFSRTHSNFGVSGLIVSFTIPGFLLMAFAGLAADLIDRKLIIILANVAIALVVPLILWSSKAVYASIPLSFLYFAGNVFFIPASSAASAQLVKKRYLLSGNSIFIFTLASGLIFGLFAAAIFYFFFDRFVTLLICEGLLIWAALMSFFLPTLTPHRKRGLTIIKTLYDIWKAFIYIFGQKVVWFFFIIFAFMQGVISFGVTLAPGFFQDIVGMPIDRSPIFILPFVGIGAAIGAFFVQNPDIKESFLVALGMSAIGLAGLVLGLIVKYSIIQNGLFYLPVGIFLIVIGFGEITVMIVSRSVLQQKVAHNYQGTIFGALIILASFFAGIFAPVAAFLQSDFGYINLLFFGGLVFLGSGLVFGYFAQRWRF